MRGRPIGEPKNGTERGVNRDGAVHSTHQTRGQVQVERGLRLPSLPDAWCGLATPGQAGWTTGDTWRLLEGGAGS